MMSKCKSHIELEELIEQVRPFTEEGEVASYIPALEKANKHDLAVCVFETNGENYYAGDYVKDFTLQSISKVFALANVLEESGIDQVFSRVGMEPTGDPFNSIAKLETMDPSKPLNPMINAGALAVTSMIKGDSVNEKWNTLKFFVSRLMGAHEISFNEEVANSEFETSYQNRALCYYMKQDGIIQMEVEDLMAVYTRQCALEVNCQLLARLGALLALNGKDPLTGEQLISEQVARICKTFMVTCGMYNASGEFAIKVGIPAKSGVSGGILGVVPNRFGIGIYGPSLDKIGNSVGGWKLLELLNQHYSISIF